MHRLLILDMHIILYVVLLIIDRVCRLAISKDNTLGDAGDDWDTVWFNSNTGAPELFLAEPDRLEVDPLLAALMPAL